MGGRKRRTTTRNSHLSKTIRWLLGGPTDVTLEEVELYPADRKFRTFFTLWSYDRNDRFQEGSDDISMERFEELWKEKVTRISDIDILLYNTGFSLFKIE